MHGPARERGQWGSGGSGDTGKGRKQDSPSEQETQSRAPSQHAAILPQGCAPSKVKEKTLDWGMLQRKDLIGEAEAAKNYVYLPTPSEFEQSSLLLFWNIQQSQYIWYVSF